MNPKCVPTINVVVRHAATIEEKKYFMSVFLDLKKAFDTVDHDILLAKLHTYGIRGAAHTLIKSYLKNRKQFVQVQNVCSSYTEVICGVPQGSILGPLLFIVYINDLAKVSELIKLILFADDSSTHAAHSELENLQSIMTTELEKIASWLTENKLTLNISKTKAMIICPRQKLYDKKSVNIKLLGEKINLVSSLKFLGVIIDEHLTWNLHIQNLCGKISRSVGMMRRLQRFLNLSSLKTLYHSFVLPYLNYANTVWSHTSYNNINRLKIVQKRAVRLITAAKLTDHSKPLFLSLKILPIEKLILYNEMTLVFKIMHNIVHYEIDKVVLNADVHCHNTRSANKLHVRYNRTNLAKNSFLNVARFHWEALPEHLREVKTFNSFKQKLKFHYLNELRTN